MNIQIRAILYTVGALAAMVTGASLIVAIANFSGTNVTMVFSILVLMFLIWTMYSLILSKLQIEKNINEVENRNK
jgi:hypothetical protein